MRKRWGKDGVCHRESQETKGLFGILEAVKQDKTRLRWIYGKAEILFCGTEGYSMDVYPAGFLFH